MRYVVRGWFDERKAGRLSADAETKADALEKALSLKTQGIQHVNVIDETGREFTLNEFAEFCGENK